MAIIVASVTLDLRDGGPVVEVISGFVEGMVGRCRASEEVEEPGRHGLGSFFIEVVGGEEQVDSVGFLIVVLADEEADSSVRAEFDPLGVHVVSLASRDLGGDLPVVVLITMGSNGKLKLPISLS